MKSKRQKPRSSDFKPNRAFIQDAVREYIERGGTIEKIETGPDDYAIFMRLNDRRWVDNFLMGD